MRALKKGSFRLVHRNVWENLAKFGKGNYREALAFLYLETGPHSNYTGLFQAPLVDIAKYTSMTNAETVQAIGNLSRAGWIVYDQDRQMVFVKGMLQRQLGTSTPNEDNTKGVLYHVERMPEESPAVESFITANREMPEIDELYEIMYGGDTPGGDTGGLTTGATPTRDFELKTLNLKLETSNEKLHTVIAVKSPALTPCVQPSSSSPNSTPNGNVYDDTPCEDLSPLGSSSTSTPGSKSKAKASGKGKRGNGHGLSNAQMKTKGLKIVAKNYHAGKLDVAELSNVLRNEYGYTQAEINSPVVMDTLFPKGKVATN